jgi:hypothetical protein
METFVGQSERVGGMIARLRCHSFCCCFGCRWGEQRFFWANHVSYFSPPACHEVPASKEAFEVRLEAKEMARCEPSRLEGCVGVRPSWPFYTCPKLVMPSHLSKMGSVVMKRAVNVGMKWVDIFIE